MNESAPPNHATVREITLDELRKNTALRAQLLDGERVHLASEKNLENRFAATDDRQAANRCYGVFGPNSDAPSAVVYIQRRKLKKNEATHVPDKNLPGDIMAILKGKNTPLADADTAIFYSISSFDAESLKLTKAQCEGMGTGEYLIKKAAKQLNDEGISTFSTLSPLRQYSKAEQPSDDDLAFMRAEIAKRNDPDIDPELSGISDVKRNGFRVWLEKKLHTMQRPNALFTRDEMITVESLANELSYSRMFEGRASQTISAKKQFADKFLYVVGQQLGLPPDSYGKIQKILGDLALEYLISSLSSTIDPVAKFHLSNGAYLGNIHVKPPLGTETSKREWESAFGVMVNYVYELDTTKLKVRKDAYKACTKKSYGDDASVPLHEIISPELLDAYRARQAALNQGRGASL